MNQELTLEEQNELEQYRDKIDHMFDSMEEFARLSICY
jgi:hypothetical protein